MAASASSSAAAIHHKKYDIFISFRGPDTRSNLTRHLRDALLQKQIKVFIDDKIPKGDDISTALFRAIEKSHASIIIFSENFASSKWCLDELVKVLECWNKGHNVVPVFYAVDPSDVRRQRRSYMEAFQKREGNPKYAQDRVNKWKEALVRATDFCGWHWRNESHLIHVINDIVKDVSQKLAREGLKCPFVINENLAPIESLLREVGTIGIWGMVGTGKTTIAKWLFDKYSSQYEGSCFLANIWKRSGKHGQELYDLRNELVSKLLGEDERTTNVESTFDKRRFCCKRVFIVLDDVGTSKQLEYLFGEFQCFGPGSRIIITTRDKHVLTKGGVDAIHKVEELNSQESLQLFSLNAFNQNYPILGYEELSKRAIDYAKGMPFALEVLGSLFHSKSENEWESALTKLKGIPNEKIQTLLRSSYDGLNYEEREMFLDNACSSFSSDEFQPKKHDVFISFSGEDICSSFISYLGDALRGKQIETYIDNKLHRDEVLPALFKAIEESHMSLIIFSENYGSSKWCMDELLKILKCRKKGQVVIPVFYNLNPSGVRKQSKIYDQERLKKYKEALVEAANIAGWVRQYGDDESEFIDKIVEDVLQTLARKELKCLFGIYENLAPIVSLFREVQTIGIWGTGGIGKTTIAKWLFHKYSFQYEGSCFLANIREKSEKQGQEIYDLRNELVSKLLGEDERTTNVESTFDKGRFCRKRVFIVLDDVGTSKQLEYLVGEFQCFGPGSIIIITTRDKNVLTKGGVDAIHKVEELNSQESLQLFSLHAFNQNYPIMGYEELSKRAIDYAKGMPFALEVLGSFLHSRSENEWESALTKLKGISGEEIQSVLRLIYDGLNEEREVFLDDACPFIRP